MDPYHPSQGRRNGGGRGGICPPPLPFCQGGRGGILCPFGWGYKKKGRGGKRKKRRKKGKKERGKKLVVEQLGARGAYNVLLVWDTEKKEIEVSYLSLRRMQRNGGEHSATTDKNIKMEKNISINM